MMHGAKAQPLLLELQRSKQRSNDSRTTSEELNKQRINALGVMLIEVRNNYYICLLFLCGGGESDVCGGKLTVGGQCGLRVECARNTVGTKTVISVILTIVGDWGNQWAPGETSVPF